MFIIDVIPLSPGLPPGTLSYRSKKRLSPGTMVFVPLRSKSVPALVISVASIVDAKASIKSAGFALRGGTLKTVGALPESILHAAGDVAEYHATGIGGILAGLLKEVLPPELPKKFLKDKGFTEKTFEFTRQRRYEAYRKLVAAQREQKYTTLIVAPTLVEARRLSELFDDKVTLLTGALRGKRREAALAAAVSSKGVVITTSAFSWVPIERLGAIIVERPSASGYVSQRRPYVDTRVALRALALRRGLTIAYGDFPLPFELRPNPSAPLRGALSAPATIIDPREEQKESKFSALPKVMLSAITETHKEGGRSVILAVRKGYGAAVVCRDCGNTVRDERGAALSLVTLGEKRILRSADGQTKIDAEAICSVCGSWNLMPLGIGIELVIEELRKALPSADVIRFDADVIRTEAQAKAAMQRAQTPQAILVGTEVMLPYLDPEQPFELGAIASADSLLALPFWRSRERLVRVGLTLRERSKTFYLSTRLPEDSAMQTIIQTESADFFKEEIALRKVLSYPPFGHLLVFHAEGPKDKIEEACMRIEKTLHPLMPARLADRVVKRGRLRLSVVFKIKHDAWPDKELAERLRQLPPGISLHLDPESLW